MSLYPPDEPEFNFDEELSSHLVSDPVTPPENLKLSIEVGLSEYSPSGLLELIARGLLQQIGGRDKWSALLKSHLVKLADQQIGGLIQGEVFKIWNSQTDIDFKSIVHTAANEYMNELVDSSGDRVSHKGRNTQRRIEYVTSELVKKAMAEAFKEAEAEWKETAKAAIKETLAEVLASKLARSMPMPKELEG